MTTRKSLAKAQQKMLTEQLGNNIRANWCFNKWYEKIILLALIYLGIWKLVNLVVGFI